MNNVYILGDMHFSTMKEWNLEAFNKFIDWFDKEVITDNKTDDLLQLGDVVEKASNLGDTLELVTRFFNIAITKFRKIYILGGNHCHKFIDDKSQYATKYLTYLGNNQIEVIYSECILHTASNYNIICLPYKRVNGKILDDFYSNDLDPSYYLANVDLLCGHVAIKEQKTFYGGIDITKFATKNYAFGHIHTRNGIYKEHYTGSIMPFKIDEEKTELERCIKILGPNSLTELQIPNFIKYEEINFSKTPKFTKNSDKLVHIYTIKNCKNLNQAKNFYSNYYIRGLEKDQVTEQQINKKEVFFLSPGAALDSMIKETKIVIKRKTLNLLKTLLG